ncbi:MAG TPA: HNH endonuclease signature motif containing protein [Actinomycetes bacterium]|jgi:hypothetical protein|nr:HNH endonuclease signature motif containing protein [Actinomycetes bacterium]
MPNRKYTPELLAEAAAMSRSVTDVLRVLGIRVSGGSHAHISRQLKRFGIDTTHFTGQAHNRGGTGLYRMSPIKRLVRLPPGSRRISGVRLKRALLSIGIPEACERCGVGTVWLGQPLTLHVDHINGDFLDNEPRNLRLLCPNCHSQTATYAGTRRDVSAPPDVVYDDAATTPTGIPLGRRIPHRREWLWDVYVYATKGP